MNSGPWTDLFVKGLRHYSACDRGEKARDGTYKGDDCAGEWANGFHPTTDMLDLCKFIRISAF